MTLAKEKLWTVEQYHQMADAGILNPDERIELLEGKIIVMAAKKPPHSVVNQLAADYLRDLLKDRAVVRVQEPVHLDDHSEPEPGIALVKHPLRQYLDHHPTPNEIFLLVEVADATLKLDTKKKAKMYAEAGIGDYWVVDAIAHRVYTFCDPLNGKYAAEDILNPGDTVRPMAFLDVEVEIGRFFL